MEYIRKNIERKINFLECNESNEELKVVYQAFLEYLMVYVLSYLWDKYFHLTEPETKTYIYERIKKPSIGDIEAICRKLDRQKEIFKDKALSRKFSKYPQFRNEKIGHGYIFSDESKNFISELKGFCDTIKNSGHNIFEKEVDIIKVNKIENNTYKGVSYKSDGSNYLPWSFPYGTKEFEINSIYGYYLNNDYFKLSPFIELLNEGEYYIYSSISEPLSGKAKYNRLLKSGVEFFERTDFCNIDIESDNVKRKSQNGTIINLYNKNYTKFIETAVKDNILDFLLNSKHSVTATIWGHGGVGKTATVQKICDDLSVFQERKYDYIVFTTAKDRSYNYLTGNIEEQNERISTFEELVIAINKVIHNNSKFDIESIINFQQNLLLIIDDFETFSDEEKDKISDFIRKLNINQHRVLITTRANIIIGEELKTNELDLNDTASFLKQVFLNEIGDQLSTNNFLQNLEQDDIIKKVHWITSGRPLFIYQLAYLIAQKGNLEDALKFDIKKSENAINFLYGRIYDYLTPLAKDIFAAISLLVTEEDLSNVVKKLSYILNLENNEDEFNNALAELIKLKILEIKENNFFYLYSKEILLIMRDRFNSKPDWFKGNCKKRLSQISRDKKLDTEQALLQFANTNRYSKNEEEVVSSYKQILNRKHAPKEIRLQAILNLTSYLVIDRGKRESAIKILNDSFNEFNDEGQFIKMLSTYYWANGSETDRDKSIKILGDYLSKHKNLKIDINLELLGLLLTYKTILTVSKKENLKDKLHYNEITRKEFSERNKNIKQDFKNIAKYHGWPLYNFVDSIDFETISSGSRQNIVTGFYQFSEIFSRLNDYKNSIKICEFALENFPENFHKLFLSKLERVKSYNYKKNKVKQNYQKPSEFGQILKEAIDKKE